MTATHTAAHADAPRGRRGPSAGEVPGVGAQCHPPGPGRDMRPADPLALVVIGHAAFLAAVDLHVGGVQVDRDRPAGQRRRPRRRQQRQHPPGHHGQPGLHRLPLRRSKPAGQPRRGRGRRPRHRSDLLADPGTAIPLLDRADSRIQRPDHAEPGAQLGDRGQARVRRQRRIRRADPRLLPRFWLTRGFGSDNVALSQITAGQRILLSGYVVLGPWLSGAVGIPYQRSLSVPPVVVGFTKRGQTSLGTLPDCQGESWPVRS